MGVAEVLRFPVRGIDRASAAETIVDWARDGQSRVVITANVHMVMEAWDDPVLSSELRRADLSVPDGKPLVWALKLLGVDSQHVRGADLTLEVCRRTQEAGLPMGLYGSAPETLEAFRGFLERQFPALKIAFAVSPEFRQLSESEDNETIEAIRSSQARVLLVGLGCPKQERWMMAHRGRVQCVMIGIGAAFSFLGGTAQSAPRWMQRSGLEWLFRLATDPRRLWKRYLKHNPRFLALFGFQYLRHLLGRLVGKGDAGEL